MQTKEYDLVVIGSGPAGQKGAICASKLGKQAAIVDRKLAMLHFPWRGWRFPAN